MPGARTRAGVPGPEKVSRARRRRDNRGQAGKCGCRIFQALESSGAGFSKPWKGGGEMELTVLSAAFAMGAAIPPKYTCMGEDVSPPLSWSQVPEGTQSIAIISDDPDAPGGDWVHWLIWNLPPDTRELKEGVPRAARLENGAVQGTTDWGQPGYRGPCPPSGTHRYFFKVYALDTKLNLPPSARKRDLLKAMEGHILAQGQLMGTFRRR